MGAAINSLRAAAFETSLLAGSESAGEKYRGQSTAAEAVIASTRLRIPPLGTGTRSNSSSTTNPHP